MNPPLYALVQTALAAISRDEDDDDDVALLAQLLHRFQQERRGFVGGAVDKGILETWGAEAHAIRVGEDDVREIVRAVADRSRSTAKPSAVATALLSAPEAEEAVTPILWELERLRPTTDPEDDMVAAMLLHAVSEFTHREDVRAALRRYAGVANHTDDAARSIATYFGVDLGDASQPRS